MYIIDNIVCDFKICMFGFLFF